MKTKTKIIIVLCILLYLGLIFAMKRADSGNNELVAKVEELSALSVERSRERKAAAEGDVVYDENAQTAADKKDQWVADYIEEHKDLFKGKEHLFESEDAPERTIDLKMFKQGEEYHFGAILWDSTFEQVKNIVPYSLLADPDSSPEGYTYYVSEDKHDLYGQTAQQHLNFMKIS